jgi:LuxR family maltose regulon positive regulatory protein
MQILSTKLSIPPVRLRSVQRSRLIQMLNGGLEDDLILVSAPAGYGKSTLLSSWLDQLGFPSAWISLDDKDNDCSRFLAYLWAACLKIDPEVKQLPEISFSFHPECDIEIPLTPLVNQLDQLAHPFCLVLDDYHVIQDSYVHQSINFLIEHRPQPLHLVIATRSDPPLPLAKLRSHSKLLELRMADLRFTTQEAAEFLDHTMGLKVLLADVSRITTRTEGWIAGLQMAALSMQNVNDVSSFIDTFTGSHHYIFDYLLEEILGRQSPEIQHFLLYTSTLEQLSAPLCDALLEDETQPSLNRPSSAILEELEHSNLFIIPLDHEQRWYRYHPLFAELLRGYLKKTEPGQLPVLHSRACDWFENQAMIADAIQHAFAFNDWERSVRLISANIFALLEQNELSTIIRQIDILSGEQNQARPWLLIGYAWLLGYTGQIRSVEPVLKEIESEFDNLRSETELQTLGGHVAAIRAYTNWIDHHRDLAANAARVALEWLPPDERLIRCQAATLLGLTLDDFTLRAQVFEQALAYARECRPNHVTIFTQGCWAWLLAMQGRLHQAQDTCMDAIHQVQSPDTPRALPTLSHVYSTLSYIYCEWDDLESAIQYSKEAVTLAHHWGQADALHFALDNLGYALFAYGDTEGAFDTLRQAWKVAHQTSAWFEQISLCQEVSWYLAFNDLDQAILSLHRSGIELDQPTSVTISSTKSGLLPLVVIRVFIAQGQYSNALALIDLVHQELVSRNIGSLLIHLHILQALAYHNLKQGTQALAALKHALILAAPGSYLRSFIQEGPQMFSLLQQARSAGITPVYVDALLSAFTLAQASAPRQKITKSTLVEPLSARELEVLRLLAQGLADKKIAEKLVIAPETVHKHLKNIYGKLDVHSRTEAINRSLQLGLL